MASCSSSLPPILCAHMLRQVDGRLVHLLRSLEPGEWNAATPVPHWTVRDIAAHLLDTALRKLSMVRDSCLVEPVAIRSLEDVSALVNRLNREGVAVYRRLSPPVLIGMMEIACEQSAAFHESLDPFGPAAFGVSWAGEEVSLNWFDTARELTERWHHQQQIRVATNRAGIMTPELYHPVLDCFLRGLPFLYRDVDAPAGTLVVVEVTGECGGRWHLVRTKPGWELSKPAPGSENLPMPGSTARIAVPQELAWRVFTRGVGFQDARKQVRIEGDHGLGERVLRLTAIVG